MKEELEQELTKELKKELKEELHIAFIGAGNMAMSLVRGLLSHDNYRITVADVSSDALARYDGLDVVTTQDNQAAVANKDLIVLAVKPQVAQAVMGPLELTSDQVLVSIAAGIPISALAAWTDPAQPIVRTMPNTPALLGAGMTALYANEHLSASQRANAQAILAAAGSTLWVDSEADLDAVTAVSGSGPAYFFLLMEAMVDAGVALGLSKATATQLTLQTAYGAALMARDTEDGPGTLRENVTSPGGTTQAALESMNAAGLPDIIQTALSQAARRSEELAQQFGE